MVSQRCLKADAIYADTKQGNCGSTYASKAGNRRHLFGVMALSHKKERSYSLTVRSKQDASQHPDLHQYKRVNGSVSVEIHTHLF